MKNLRALLSYGFLIWLIPFVTSFFIFTLRESDRYFFETLMTLILVGATSFVLIRYSKRNPIDSAQEGLMVGLIWLFLNLFLDFFVFIIGPLRMDAFAYLKEIGLDYLTIPIITTMIGILHRESPAQKNPAN
jgi:hypothetical protein